MATRVQKKESSLLENAHRFEIAAVVILAFAVLVFLSLVSYSETDYVPFITLRPQMNQKI